MAEDKTAKPPGPRGGRAQDDRAARLAAALRANLARRKARARAAEGGAAQAGAGQGPDAGRDGAGPADGEG